MSDETEKTETVEVTGNALLEQVGKDLAKQTREKVKGNLKNMLAEKAAAEQALRLINAKIEKFLGEYEAGTLVFEDKDKS